MIVFILASMTNNIISIKLQLKIKNLELQKAVKEYNDSVRGKKDYSIYSPIVNRINKINSEITELTMKLKNLESLE